MDKQTTLMCTGCGKRPPLPWDGKTRPYTRCEKCSTAKQRMKWKQRLVGDPVEAVRKKARDAVKAAKQSGRIVPVPCAVCRGTRALQAHHHDYSQPLNVTWLCAGCHKAIDQLLEIFPLSAKHRVELEAWCPPQYDSRLVDA